MNNDIFRKKSMEQIQSPERLNDYLRATNPGVWLILAAVIALLAGACLWGLFGHLDSTAPAEVQVENGEAVCIFRGENIIEIGMPVIIGETEGTISSVERTVSGVRCGISVDAPLPDGTYPAEIVTECLRPIIFLWN